MVARKKVGISDQIQLSASAADNQKSATEHSFLLQPWKPRVERGAVRKTVARCIPLYAQCDMCIAIRLPPNLLPLVLKKHRCKALLSKHGAYPTQIGSSVMLPLELRTWVRC